MKRLWGVVLIGSLLAACAPSQASLATESAATAASLAIEAAATASVAQATRGAFATQEAAATAQYLDDYGPCGLVLVEQTADDLSDVAQRWDDAVSIADSTPRMSLPDRIADLQEVRRDTQGLEAPPCLDEAKSYLVLAMDSTIEGFIAFLGQKPDGEVTSHFRSAANRMDLYGDELRRVRACAPACE